MPVEQEAYQPKDRVLTQDFSIHHSGSKVILGDFVPPWICSNSTL